MSAKMKSFVFNLYTFDELSVAAQKNIIENTQSVKLLAFYKKSDAERFFWDGTLCPKELRGRSNPLMQ